MIIGIPKEIKVRESRVAIVPGGVSALVGDGNEVLIEAGAGLGSGIRDEDFERSGARILPKASEVWANSEMIMKVKEPVESEYTEMREGQILYTYLHLAAVPSLANALLERKVTSIAYETIELEDGSLPLLKPMSEVAGRMAVQVGARCLEKNIGGKGLLLGGVPGVKRGRVVIIGGGVVGLNAAKMATGMGAVVTILDIDQSRLAYLDDIFGTAVTTLMSNAENIAKSVKEADLVIGAVLVTGNKAPILVNQEMIASMADGSAVVDVAIDQGGSIETIRPTTHDQPVYVEKGVIHYGVTNIPGAVPMTSAYALTNVTLEYARKVASMGVEAALRKNRALQLGLNTYKGSVTHAAVADALGLTYKSFQEL